MEPITEIKATINSFIDQFSKQERKIITKLSEQTARTVSPDEIEARAAEREVLRLQTLRDQMQSCAPAVDLLTRCAQQDTLTHDDIFQAHDAAIDLAVDMGWSIDEAPRASTASARESFFCMYTTIQAYQLAASAHTQQRNTHAAVM